MAGRVRVELVLILLLAVTAGIGVSAAVEPAPLPDYNNIFVRVANEAGAKYDTFGNESYNFRFEGFDRGLNPLHVSTDPAAPAGQVTTTNSRSGTFYATDTGGKGFEDEVLLLVAVNGTVSDDFSLRITADGYTWTPNPVVNAAPTTYAYQPVALDETFTEDDLIYGPQTWRPSGNGFSYPLFEGQDTAVTENTFRLMLIDLGAGVLGPNPALENRGAVRVRYSFEHLPSFASFNVYGYCNNPNQGEGVAWTNRMGQAGASGFSVSAPPVVMVPSAAGLPHDLNGDGCYEDVNGNSRTDFADVVLYFNQMSWIAENEPIGPFDFNGNGRIDFADVVWLFTRL